MIGDKLKEIREDTGMNKREFATYIDVKYTTYNGYETGTREPDSDFLVMISKKFDVSTDYILGLQNAKEIKHSYELKSSEYKHIEMYRELDTHGQEMVDFMLEKEWERSTTARKEDTTPPIHNVSMRLINYYYRLASAGTGQIIFDTPPTKRIEIPNIPEYRKADYAIGVSGNSMEPMYSDGDTLLVEMTDEIETGEIGIFLVNSESYVKKLGRSELISLNPNYENIPLTENSKCMGKVIGKL